VVVVGGDGLLWWWLFVVVITPHALATLNAQHTHVGTCSLSPRTVLVVAGSGGAVRVLWCFAVAHRRLMDGRWVGVGGGVGCTHRETVSHG